MKRLRRSLILFAGLACGGLTSACKRSQSEDGAGRSPHEHEAPFTKSSTIYDLLAGDWHRVEVHSVPEVSDMPGHSFRPTPPESFEMTFRGPKDWFRSFSIPGLEGYDEASIRRLEDGSVPTGEIEPKYVVNTGSYFGYIHTGTIAPRLEISVMVSPGDADSIAPLAVYEKAAP